MMKEKWEGIERGERERESKKQKTWMMMIEKERNIAVNWIERMKESREKGKENDNKEIEGRK